jgi:hypothetical protein
MSEVTAQIEQKRFNFEKLRTWSNKLKEVNSFVDSGLALKVKITELYRVYRVGFKTNTKIIITIECSKKPSSIGRFFIF